MELDYNFTQAMVDVLNAGGAREGVSEHDYLNAVGSEVRVRVHYQRAAGNVWRAWLIDVRSGGLLDMQTLRAQGLDLEALVERG